MATYKKSVAETSSAVHRTARTRRNLNAQSVVEILRTAGPLSQAALARQADLSPATVNKIVQSLREEGVAEIQWINGREALVALIPKRGTIVSICVGPESIRGAAFSFGQNKRFDATLNMREGLSGPESVVQLVRELAARAGVGVEELIGVSIAMQAPVDGKSGHIAPWASVRLPAWKGVAIRKALESALGVPVAIDNDANLGALAEWTWGAGRKSDCFLFIACSAGIGGGLVLDGKIHHGGNGMALEIGHVVIDRTGPVCFCGSRGCLSTVASERSILLALQGSESPRDSLEDVIASAADGDPICQRVLIEAGRNLGHALANMAKILAPSVIAVGGVLASAGDRLFSSIEAAIEENNVPVLSPSVQLCPAQLGDDATILGGLAAVMGELGQGMSELPTWMRDVTMPEGYLRAGTAAA